MTREDDLLRAIRHDPDDDSLRLVYADWLEEHGGPEGLARAEFIRVQMELARAGGDDPRAAGLRARQDALLERHGADWAAPVAGLAREYTFRRGFVEEVTLSAARFLSQGEK